LVREAYDVSLIEWEEAVQPQEMMAELGCSLLTDIHMNDAQCSWEALWKYRNQNLTPAGTKIV
jgi:hypothetical protein